ncbi:MAG: hypothetical protein H7A35_02405 [Planctomycetales bacterium]|nr:hypothetical protein [bacterium]UNM08910.1 MAG: hypothetical protein H7A35_02405 [Planctomycetales bacterium]
MARIRLLLLLPALCCLLSACSGSRSEHAAGTQLLAASAQQQPGIPLPQFPVELPDAPRSSSVGLNLTVDGGLWHASTEAKDMQSFVTLTAPAQEVRWAYWRFPGLAADLQVASLTANLSHFSGGPMYVLIADFASGSWHVKEMPLEAGGQVVELFGGAAADYFSPAGNLYIGVLVYDGRSTVVENLTLIGNGALLPPANLDATDAKFADRVEISWDQASGATGYRLYYKLAGEDDSAYGLLADLSGADSTYFEHRADNPPAKPCVYAQHYVYRVQSTANLEQSVQYSNADEGARQLPAVAEFYASERAFGDHVHIAGVYFKEATEVDLYRDSVKIATVPIASFEFSYDDDPGDFAAHEYNVLAIGAEGPSAPRQPVNGCLADWDYLSVALHPFTGETRASAAVINGVPAIAYWLEQPQRLHYAYADAAQPSGWTDVELANTYKVDARMSLVEVNGKPWIAFSFESRSGIGTDRKVFVVSSTKAQPTTFTDFSNEYYVYIDDCDADAVVMKQINGGLGLVFANDDYPGGSVVYAYSSVAEPAQDDWSYSIAGTLPADPVWDFDIADFNGVPGVVMQTNTELHLSLAHSPSPSVPADWDSHRVLDISSSSYGNSAGVDMHERNGLPAIACAWGNLEGVGAVAYLLSGTGSMPAVNTDWTGGIVVNLNDQEPKNLSMDFIGDIPYISWSDDLNANAWLASAIYPVPGYLNGFWNVMQLPGPAGFDRCRMEVNTLDVDGNLGVFWSSQNLDYEPDRLETVYSFWQPKP